MVRYSDLMLGDYVLVNGIPRRVEAITKKKIGYHIEPQRDKRLYYARFREVKPIEVTRELLGRLGIPVEEPIDDAQPRFRIEVIDDGSGDDIFCIGLQNVHEDDYDVVFDVCYLHQLQRAFKILGIEKEFQV